MKKKKSTVPDVMLAIYLPDMLKADIVRRGLWRCYVLHPGCPGKPYAQVRRPSLGPNSFGLYCLKHTLFFANKEGFTVPLAEHN